jgi:hypothetical protein
MDRNAVLKAKSSGVKRIPEKSDMSFVEEETIQRVDRTISTIEGFLARWDGSRLKPDDMFPQVVKIKRFHDALLSWQKEAVRSRGKEDDAARMKRLQDFVLICRTYS